MSCATGGTEELFSTAVQRARPSGNLLRETHGRCRGAGLPVGILVMASDELSVHPIGVVARDPIRDWDHFRSGCRRILRNHQQATDASV